MLAPSIRGRDALRAENGGRTAWCGPSGVALATGMAYPQAEAAIRAANPARYGRKPMRTTWWDDLMATLRSAGVELVERDHLAVVAIFGSYPTLANVTRKMPPGWYLLRVTGHFLLLHRPDAGPAVIYDNQMTGVPVGERRARARRRVTHVARVLTGPLAS